MHFLKFLNKGCLQNLKTLEQPLLGGKHRPRKGLEDRGYMQRSMVIIIVYLSSTKRANLLVVKQAGAS